MQMHQNHEKVSPGWALAADHVTDAGKGAPLESSSAIRSRRRRPNTVFISQISAHFGSIFTPFWYLFVTFSAKLLIKGAQG